jgi:hypothetical protein
MAKARTADRQGYWRGLIERQQASGQSIVRFCSEEGLAPASFHAWKRRLRPQRGTGRTSVKQALVPVEIVNDSAAAVGRLEIQWPGGVMLRVQGCDGQTVASVVATLSASPARRARRC